ncbi:MAG: hypothetical protein IPF53_00230 [Blastocatellia bacterium]|jgi:ElaB/YqjD/DUF883 family membrane-anchored ribosome-binding protein|nr:hypothetical protein [Blastocatellia bacterium]
MSASNKPELVQNSIEQMGERAGHVAGKAAANAVRIVDSVNANVNEAMTKSVETVKEKARQVKEYGVDGVKNDVVSYTRQKPFAALLIAGAVGALAALLLRRK